jgi:hypothetical protein
MTKYTEFLQRVEKRKQIIIDAYNNINNYINEGEFFIAGGCFTKLDEEVNDFDVFFKDEKSFSKQLNYLEKINYSIKARETINSTSFLYNGRMYDLINKKFFKDPEEIINEFDFTCCQAVYDGQKFHFGEQYLKHNFRKQLAINKITYPVHTLKRVIKYNKQGYWICNGGIQHLVESLRKAEEIDIRSIELTSYPFD